MINRPITITFLDDEGAEVTETGNFWFHLFEEELLEWESKYKEGLGVALQRLLKEDDKEQIFAFFKKIILDSYGERSDGGRKFNKSPEIRREFEQTIAYKTLFAELCTSEEEAAKFINGIFPKFKVQDKPAEVVATKTTP